MTTRVDAKRWSIASIGSKQRAVAIGKRECSCHSRRRDTQSPAGSRSSRSRASDAGSPRSPQRGRRRRKQKTEEQQKVNNENQVETLTIMSVANSEQNDYYKYLVAGE